MGEATAGKGRGTECPSERLVVSSPSALALIKDALYELEGRSFTEAIRLTSEVNAIGAAP